MMKHCAYITFFWSIYLDICLLVTPKDKKVMSVKINVFYNNAIILWKVGMLGKTVPPHNCEHITRSFIG